MVAVQSQAQTGPVVNAMSGLCLQVNGTVAAGSRLQTATCVPGSAKQTFTRTNTNELRINGNLCVDAYGGGKQAAEVGLWTCQGSLNERWGPNNGWLITENNFCMAVDGGNRNPGTRIIAYSCLNDNSQKWSLPGGTPAPAPAPPANSGLASGNTAIMQMIASAYPADFGRPARQDEIAYWGSQRANDPRVASRAGFLQNNIAFLRSNQPERRAMIQAAYQQVWGIAVQVGSKEMNYWEPIVTNGRIVFSNLRQINDSFKSANPTYRPGQVPATKLSRPYSVLDAESGSFLDQLIAMLNPPAVIPPGPVAFPPASVKPRMRIPNPSGVSGPFAIAATSDQRPDLSFCLDVTSLTAGTPAIAAQCHNETQLWNLDSGTNRITLASNSNLCLDGGDKPWHIDPRHKVPVVNTCNGSRNQQWYVGMIAGARAGAPYTDDHWHLPAPTGQIQNIGTSACLNLEGAKTDTRNPNTVIMFDCYTLNDRSTRPWNTIWGAGHLMNSGAVYIFSRKNSPPLAGHTGWAVELADGSWLAGTYDGSEMVDGPGIVNKGHNNDAWRHRFTSEADLRQWYLEGRVRGSYPGDNIAPQMGYDQYMKWEFTGLLNSAAVFALEAQSWDWGYGLLGNNCADVTYKVLKAYGWSGLSSLADQRVLAPNDWFRNVLGGTKPFDLHR
jgi:hypothetical protein